MKDKELENLDRKEIEKQKKVNRLKELAKAASQTVGSMTKSLINKK